jgi:hypothetical protein
LSGGGLGWRGLSLRQYAFAHGSELLSRLSGWVSLCGKAGRGRNFAALLY